MVALLLHTSQHLVLLPLTSFPPMDTHGSFPYWGNYKPLHQDVAAVCKELSGYTLSFFCQSFYYSWEIFFPMINGYSGCTLPSLHFHSCRQIPGLERSPVFQSSPSSKLFSCTYFLGNSSAIPPQLLL